MSVFSEPMPFPGQDPWIVPFEGWLLLIQSIADSRELSIVRFRDLASMHDNDEKVIWRPPRRSDHRRELWAPELHEIDGRWYVYYAASDGQNRNHRSYVLAADQPLGPYEELGKIADPAHDVWAIDLTVFRNDDGRLYAVWSGWEGVNDGFPQNLYIAPMSDAWTISGERTLISRPDQDWEMSVAPINEGPEILRNPEQNKLFIVYSADASWTVAYKMGVLEWLGGDVTDARSWRKLPGPIFTGGGHGCFVEVDGARYVVYHRKSTSDPGWADREIHYAPLRWDADGYPIIGRRGEDPRTAGRVPGETDQAASQSLGPHLTIDQASMGPTVPPSQPGSS
jgi:GH43 family beta-xylosidase